jgi:hypothetical protein
MSTSSPRHCFINLSCSRKKLPAQKSGVHYETNHDRALAMFQKIHSGKPGAFPFIHKREKKGITTLSSRFAIGLSR